MRRMRKRAKRKREKKNYYQAFKNGEPGNRSKEAVDKDHHQEIATIGSYKIIFQEHGDEDLNNENDKKPDGIKSFSRASKEHDRLIS